MSSPPTQPDQPHLVSLVLQSKKALQHGEQLCSRAHAVSNTSAHSAINVVALDAKVRWVTDAVAEQLKVSALIHRSYDDEPTSFWGVVGCKRGKEYRGEALSPRETSAGE
jgi:autophagy-related protein 17